MIFRKKKCSRCSVIEAIERDIYWMEMESSLHEYGCAAWIEERLSSLKDELYDAKLAECTCRRK